jgi:hypothetical protein
MTNAELALAAPPAIRPTPRQRPTPPPPTRARPVPADGRTPRAGQGQPRPAPSAGRPVDGRAPRAAAGAGRRPARSVRPLAVVTPSRPGPVVGLGLVWAVALVGAAALGSVALLVLLLPVAVVAAASGARAVRRQAGPLTVVGTVCAPLTAVLAVGVASAQDPGVAVILVVAVCLFDAANFVTGTGPTGGVVGALAGAVSVALLMVILAAVAPAPLAGRPIDALAVVAVVLCPAGVFLGRRLTGPTRLPAFRRLDSLILAGPAWVVVTAVALHR